MSIGVVTVAVGEPYTQRLIAWADAVATLERTPDVVTVVSNRLGRDLVTQLDDILGDWQLVGSARSWRHHPQVLINDAIQMTDTDWICKMDADDLFLPHALNDVDDATDADVFMFGIEIQGRGLTFAGVQADMIVRAEQNLVFSGSPFRRWLWTDNQFRDMIYEDWAFWIGCAKQGARFKSSGRVDYIYQLHDGQITKNIDEQYWTTIVRSLA